MDEGVFQSQKVVVVMLIKFAVELRPISIAGPSQKHGPPYQVQNGNFHHALVEVGGLVLDDLYRDDLLRLEILTLYHLPECSLAQYIENEISIPAEHEN